MSTDDEGPNLEALGHLVPRHGCYLPSSPSAYKLYGTLKLSCVAPHLQLRPDKKWNRIRAMKRWKNVRPVQRCKCGVHRRFSVCLCVCVSRAHNCADNAWPHQLRSHASSAMRILLAFAGDLSLETFRLLRWSGDFWSLRPKRSGLDGVSPLLYEHEPAISALLCTPSSMFAPRTARGTLMGMAVVRERPVVAGYCLKP